MTNANSPVWLALAYLGKSRMIYSRCHKDEVYVVHDYYVCCTCHIHCDTMSIFNGVIDSHDDTGYLSEAEKVFG